MKFVCACKPLTASDNSGWLCSIPQSLSCWIPIPSLQLCQSWCVFFSHFVLQWLILMKWRELIYNYVSSRDFSFGSSGIHPFWQDLMYMWQLDLSVDIESLFRVILALMLFYVYSALARFALINVPASVFGKLESSTPQASIGHVRINIKYLFVCEWVCAELLLLCHCLFCFLLCWIRSTWNSTWSIRTAVTSCRYLYHK